jgi:type IV secretion system protein VirB6
MTGLCPAPDADIPLVRGLLRVVDCNVQGLVRGGYATLFEPSGSFSIVLTSLLTIFVAILGYRLLLGQAQLRVGEVALTAVKIGVILALTTGWSTYQTVVYNFLFHGPAELADAMLIGVQPRGSLFRGDVFDGLQTVFDALNAFAARYGQQAQSSGLPGTGTGIGGGSFGPQALTAAAMILLLSSLGVVLAAKVVLGLLLAIGPIFIALMLFDSTRGLFEGWLRASVAFAFAPLAATVILGVTLTVLEPSLLQMQAATAANDFSMTPIYAVVILVIVFAGVSVGALVAGGIIALGLRLPQARALPVVSQPQARETQNVAEAPVQSRAARVAAAAAALERRDAAVLAYAAPGEDRRSSISVVDRNIRTERGVAGTAPETRLTQGPRRANPRSRRANSRSGS